MKIMIPATNGMRSVALTLCAFAVASAPVWAQTTQDAPLPPPQSDGSARPAHPRMEHMQERHLEMMTKHLNLTPDQVAQVKAIDEDGMTQMKALHQDTTTARADKHAKMEAIHDAQTTKIRAILTDDQKPKFDKMIARQHDRMEHHRDHGGDANQPAPPPPAA